MHTLQLPKSQPILAILAHPDDELLMASLLRELVLSNCIVTIICLTGGEGAQKDTAGEALAKTRRMELEASSKIIGIRSHSIWNVPDGGVSDYPRTELIHKLSREIKNTNPHWILTFAPDGWTHHKDHQGVSHLAVDAAKESGMRTHVLGVTAPAEYMVTILPKLQGRRKTKNVYNDKVSHPELKNAGAVPRNQELITQIIHAHASQNLGSYLEIFEHLNGMEYYTELYAHVANN